MNIAFICSINFFHKHLRNFFKHPWNFFSLTHTVPRDYEGLTRAAVGNTSSWEETPLRYERARAYWWNHQLQTTNYLAAYPPNSAGAVDYNILLHISDRSVHQHISSCNDLCCNIFPTYSPHRIRNLTPITQKEQLIIAHILGPFLFAFFPQTPFWALGAKSPRAIPFPMAIPLCTKFSTFLGCGGMMAPWQNTLDKSKQKVALCGL